MSLFTSAIANVFSSQSAAKAQKRAADAALNTQKAQYAETRGDLQPYREAGTSALSTYRDALGQNGADASKAAWGSYTESPYLPGLLSKVRDSVQASNAARGGLFSGATAQAIGDRSTQTYLEDSNRWLDRMRGLVDTGQNAATQGGQLGAQSAALQGQYYTDRGNANANSIMAPALGWRQFTQDVAGAFGAAKGGAF